MTDRRSEAREARGLIEAALAELGWPFSRQISLWVDMLLLIEEAA